MALRYFGLSLALMVGLALSLIWAWRRLDLLSRRHRGADYWFVSVPFVLYLGWITVATFANLLVALDAASIMIAGEQNQWLAVACIGIARSGRKLRGRVARAPRVCRRSCLGGHRHRHQTRALSQRAASRVDRCKPRWARCGGRRLANASVGLRRSSVPMRSDVRRSFDCACQNARAE